MSANVVWIGWLVLFLVYELYAAKSKASGDTLSEAVWGWFGVRVDRPLHRLRQLVLAAFLLALASHLVLGTTVVPVIALGVGVAAVIAWAVAKERTR